MPDRRHRGRQLRDVFITLALIFLVGAGAAYGVTRYLQSELESDANRDARKLSVDVLQPLLVPADAQGPVQGARYDELLAAVDQRVLAGPINGVLLLAFESLRRRPPRRTARSCSPISHRSSATTSRPCATTSTR